MELVSCAAFCLLSQLQHIIIINSCYPLWASTKRRHLVLSLAILFTSLQLFPFSNASLWTNHHHVSHNTQHKYSLSGEISLFPALNLCLFVLIILAFPFVFTVQHTHHKHSCTWRDSNPQSQQAIGRTPSPQTARPLGFRTRNPSTRGAADPRLSRLVTRIGFEPGTFQPVACAIPALLQPVMRLNTLTQRNVQFVHSRDNNP